jgi:hypothetical protein
MKITQLSVFMENKPGQLSLPCRLLGKAGINILSLSLADTRQFGILRLLVKEWQQAKAMLEQAGCVVKTNEVVAVEVADKPGGLATVLEHLESAGTNIEYMYAFRDRAVLVFRFEKPDDAIVLLKGKGMKILDSAALFARA